MRLAPLTRVSYVPLRQRSHEGQRNDAREAYMVRAVEDISHANPDDPHRRLIPEACRAGILARAVAGRGQSPRPVAVRPIASSPRSACTEHRFRPSAPVAFRHAQPAGLRAGPASLIDVTLAETMSYGFSSACCRLWPGGCLRRGNASVSRGRAPHTPGLAGTEDASHASESRGYERRAAPGDERSSWSGIPGFDRLGASQTLRAGIACPTCEDGAEARPAEARCLSVAGAGALMEPAVRGAMARGESRYCYGRWNQK
jgi:hypothetical protein